MQLVQDTHCLFLVLTEAERYTERDRQGALTTTILSSIQGEHFSFLYYYGHATKQLPHTHMFCFQCSSHSYTCSCSASQPIGKDRIGEMLHNTSIQLHSNEVKYMASIFSAMQVQHIISHYLHIEVTHRLIQYCCPWNKNIITHLTDIEVKQHGHLVLVSMKQKHSITHLLHRLISGPFFFIPVKNSEYLTVFQKICRN